MTTIQERAKKWSKQYCTQNRRDITYIAYEVGAKEQRMIDIAKLKEVMNRLMLDTRDKAEIIKAMEEE